MSGAQRPLSLAGRSVGYAPRGIVSTSQPLASSAGLAVLHHGGNAIDAPVTAAAVLTVTDSVRAALTAMGHVVSDGQRTQFGGAKAIIKLTRGYSAGSDPRKDGYAAGY